MKRLSGLDTSDTRQIRLLFRAHTCHEMTTAITRKELCQMHYTLKRHNPPRGWTKYRIAYEIACTLGLQ